MKKYKVYFSIFNMLTASQEEVVKLQTIFKGISATAVGTTFVMNDVKIAFFVAIGGACIDVLISCLYFEPIEKKNDDIS